MPHATVYNLGCLQAKATYRSLTQIEEFSHQSDKKQSLKVCTAIYE